MNLQCQQVVCPAGSSTDVVGQVFDPSGQVPLYNAIVYVPNGVIEPFNEGVTCDRCDSFTSGSPLVITLTGPDGKFKLSNVPAGTDIPLVYQIGKWRRQITLPTVSACQQMPLTDVNMQRMPRNKSEGDIPQMAISTGSADPFECLLLKMGIDPNEFTFPSANGRVHVYRQNGMTLDGGSVAGSQLWSDAGTLQKYDVVLLPCEGGGHSQHGAPAIQNVVNYTELGGRVFATHYSYDWTQPGWPTAANWDPGLNDLYNTTFNVTVDQSFPKGQAFSQWLYNTQASIDAGFLPLVESRHDVVSVNSDGGTTRWLFGDIASSNPSASIQHLTFNTPYNPPNLPDGGAGLQCGRVVYSDFHVTAGAVSGTQNSFPGSCKSAAAAPLTPQEKALIFMLFDVSSCVQSDAVAPTTCATSGNSCVNNSCCSGLRCLNDATSNACAAGDSACTCRIRIN